jgi:hypothetical protein
MAQGTDSRDPMPAAGLLAPLGTLLALALPFFVLSFASADATREVKLAAASAGAVLVLLGLALAPGTPVARPAAGLAGRATGLLLALFLALFVASFAAGVLGRRDPFDALPLLPALALFAWGATREGSETARRALRVLVACGAATGVLAALQRFTGWMRLPVEAPEPRFFATALIGNPGDVGAALVVPALLAATSLARGERRLASGAALGACLAGLAAAGTLAPLAAFAAGTVVLVARDFRRRIFPALAAGAVALALLAAAGVVQRAAAKLTSGDLATLTTQRDIGVLAALESIRSHPLLGAGPGGFASDFVRARLAAEERVGRRLVHRSSSAHFDNAHCDPLTAAAEAGAPAALALAAALGALLVGLLAASRREGTSPTGGHVPAEALLSCLAAVLVLSLANFPIQIVPVAGPFAFLAGLSFARAGGGLAPRKGAARAGLAALALLLAAGGATRLAAGRALARAETALRAAPAATGTARAGLLARALDDARRAAALRPRHGRSHLALGSALAARGDVTGAVASMERSVALEERAETLLNLGRLEVARGDLDAARPLFLRAVWVLPRLASAIPPAGDPDAVVAATRALEAALAAGGAPPPLPERLRPR